ncbi:MAG TPA: hypothetical protein VG368_02015 [Acidimicrobiales bacterium]|nr:hypothetical protein [Acidimicrobiales bacterium]
MKKVYLSAAGLAVVAMCTLISPVGAATHSSGGVTSTGTVAAPTTPTVATLPRGEAVFNGKVINLSTPGWGGAKSCIVPTMGNAQCFATQAEAKIAAQNVSAQEQAVYAATGATPLVRHGSAKAQATAALKSRRFGGRDDGACNQDGTQWLWLYVDANYGGASIGLQGTDTWNDLRDFGFQQTMSSYINETACEIYMIETYDSSGPWLFVSPWTYTSYVGNYWNDKITMVYIAQN